MLIAFFWVLNDNSQTKNILFKFILVLIIIFSSFNSILIHSNLNIISGFFFYLKQSNITDLIVLKEIIFFSKKAIENILLIIIFIFVLKKIKNKINFLSNLQVKNYILIIFLVLLNPFTLDFSYKNFKYDERIEIDNKVLQEYVKKIYEKNDYLENVKEKNIIFFIIESLNKEFVQNKQLMPFLNEISKKSINFENVDELDLTNFTTSGLYALLCGNLLPEYKIFKEMKCLPEILSENNYNLSFIRSDINLLDNLTNGFSNKAYYGQNKMEICAFKCLRKKIKLDEMHVWGVHDEIVFKETLSLIKKNLKNKKKFAVIAKTVDTHIEGYPSKNCTKNSSLNTKISKSFYCLDNLFKKFFTELENLENINETIVVITSDHLLMNESFSEKFGNKKKKFIFNL